jgi:hypothetical protein
MSASKLTSGEQESMSLMLSMKLLTSQLMKLERHYHTFAHAKQNGSSQTGSDAASRETEQPQHLGTPSFVECSGLLFFHVHLSKRLDPSINGLQQLHWRPVKAAAPGTSAGRKVRKPCI